DDTDALGPAQHRSAEGCVVGVGEEAAERRPRGQARKGREPPGEQVDHDRGGTEGDQAGDGTEAGGPGRAANPAHAHGVDCTAPKLLKGSTGSVRRASSVTEPGIGASETR